MSDLLKITLQPGGMNSDVVENELGNHEHQLVQNMRQDKFGNWVSVDGYKKLYEFTGANIKAAIEVTEDRTGEKFILYQDGNNLKRLDAVGGSYSGSTPQTLSLPAGVTIPTNAVLRFFYYRGVVRITGASEPMWYGYIDRLLFKDATTDITKLDFETGVDGFVGSNATVAQDSSVKIKGGYSLKITQTASGGYGYRQITSLSNTSYYRLILFYYKPGTLSDDKVRIKVGDSAGSGEYVNNLYENKVDQWVIVIADAFKPSGSSIYVSVYPSDNSASDYCYIDFFLLQKCNVVEQKGWYLYKAGIDVHDLRMKSRKILNTGTTKLATFLRYSQILDKGQYSLPHNPNRAPGVSWFSLTGVPHEIANLDCDCRMEILVPGDDLVNNWPNHRQTGILLILGQDERGVYDENTMKMNVFRYIDFEKLEPLIYSHDSGELSYDGTNNKRINWKTTSDTRKEDLELEIGQLIWIKTQFGELASKITNIVYDPTYNTIDYIELEDDICAILSGGLCGTAADLGETGFYVLRQWFYDFTEGYTIPIAFNTSDGSDFYDYTEIPAGTKDISPNYSHHVVLNERAFVVSKEEDEEDIIRYSPLFQFDVFPNVNLIQTETGDFDKNVAIVKRDDRLMILKRRSIAQVQYAGNSYYQDYSDEKVGLFSDYGYIVIGKTLYFLDKEEVYEHAGVGPRPLLVTQRMQNIYRQYVDENSKLAWDKQNNELWVILNGIILVYNPKRGEWYQRETNLNVVAAYVDANGDFVAIGDSGADPRLVNYTHGTTTYDEAVDAKIKTRIVDVKSPYFWKKLKEARLYYKSGTDIQITVSDPDKTNYTKTLSTKPADYTEERIFPKYLFKKMDVELFIQNIVDGTKKVNIKHLELIVERWNNM